MSHEDNVIEILQKNTITIKSLKQFKTSFVYIYDDNDDVMMYLIVKYLAICLTKILVNFNVETILK